MFAGTSAAEIALVTILLVVVVIAPKVPRIGEAIGALFDRPPPPLK